MAKIKFYPESAGFEKLMRSEPVFDEIKKRTDLVGGKLDQRLYTYDTRVGEHRVVGVVRSEGPHGYNHALKHNSILKALNEARY